MQSKAVFTNDFVNQSITEMAKEYVEEILKLPHSGPYILAGGSMGGVLAIEVGNLLKEHGKEIKNIIMFDTFGPEVIKILNHQSLYRRIKKWFFKKILVLIDNPIIENRYQKIEKLNYKALNSHEISSYKGNITLIRAPKQKRGVYADDYLGWRKKINGEIETIYINGIHEQFIESPEMIHAFKTALKS